MRALCFHGVGHRTPANYAAKAMSRLGAKVAGLVHRSVHWSPLLDVVQEELYADLKRRGARGNLLQDAVFTTLGDALAYRNIEPAVRLVADHEARTMGGVDVVFAHSLGVPLALGWLNTRPMANPVTLVTMGCNLGLWQAGSATNIESPRQVTRWLNLFSPTDMLGSPIGGFAPSARDIEVDVGPWYSWLVRGATHMGFWSDKTLWSRTVPALLGA